MWTGRPRVSVGFCGASSGPTSSRSCRRSAPPGSSKLLRPARGTAGDGVGGARAPPGALRVKRVVPGDDLAAAAGPPNCPRAWKSDDPQTLQQAPKCLS